MTNLPRSYAVPGSRTYRAVDEGFKELLRERVIVAAVITGAERVAYAARQIEAENGYKPEKTSTYKTETRNVTIGFKNRERIGSATVQELRSWNPVHDHVLSQAVGRAKINVP